MRGDEKDEGGGKAPLTLLKRGEGESLKRHTLFPSVPTVKFSLYNFGLRSESTLILSFYKENSICTWYLLFIHIFETYK